MQTDTRVGIVASDTQSRVTTCDSALTADEQHPKGKYESNFKSHINLKLAAVASHPLHNSPALAKQLPEQQ